VTTSRVQLELVYDPDCPNVGRARVAIRAALIAAGLREEWVEWRRDATDTPERFRALGSPSVLVNGKDVGSDETVAATADANSCRVYVDEGGRLRGAPSAELITEAIREATDEWSARR
jgi:hypothetical protein